MDSIESIAIRNLLHHVCVSRAAVVSEYPLLYDPAASYLPTISAKESLYLPMSSNPLMPSHVTLFADLLWNDARSAEWMELS